MENTLPFEQGILYKPIKVEGYTTYDIDQYFLGKVISQRTIMDRESFDYINQYDYPSSSIENVDWEYYFLPIGFIESTQKVVGEVMMVESKTILMLVPAGNNFGISFKQEKIKEYIKRTFRVEIDVNEFIKKFEKVL